MTEQLDRAALVAAVERLGADLEQAKADVALLQRLKDAEGNVKRLTAELAKAQDELTNELANATQARRKAEFAKFRDITVTEDQGRGIGPLHATYKITVKAMSFGERAEETEQEWIGFNGLPTDVLHYLIDQHPERIPASIMALGSDPYEAFDTFFAGKRRGYLLNPAA